MSSESYKKNTPNGMRESIPRTCSFAFIRVGYSTRLPTLTMQKQLHDENKLKPYFVTYLYDLISKLFIIILNQTV